ncbi:MAG: nucleoside 2-deoxyribosyltransferase [Patescibacteria group bacterium]|nr:nucleoside 2-deoxyribosyltransferase [Patescibacteria group bacterium]
MKEEKTVVRAYLANQFGFSETGRYVLDSLIKPRITAMGIVILDPFEECGKELDFAHLARLKRHDKVTAYWTEFNAKVTHINNALMRDSNCLLAVLDGGHAIDDGVASEIGYYAGIRQGKIFAVRSDFRCGENMAAAINPQILGYIQQSGGSLSVCPDAMKKWFAAIQTWKEMLAR